VLLPNASLLLHFTLRQCNWVPWNQWEPFSWLCEHGLVVCGWGIMAGAIEGACLGLWAAGKAEVVNHYHNHVLKLGATAHFSLDSQPGLLLESSEAHMKCVSYPNKSVASNEDTSPSQRVTQFPSWKSVQSSSRITQCLQRAVSMTQEREESLLSCLPLACLALVSL
jgi:hypothetical protein